MKILSNEMAQHYQVSSLQRGHLVFTSFISHKGKILFLDEHLERLLKGANFLFPNNKWELKHEELKQYVEYYFQSLKLNLQESQYFRLNVSEDTVFLQKKSFSESPLSLKLTAAKKLKTPGLTPSFLKLSNYVDADLEIKNARLSHFDDVLFFDLNLCATEASSSNIFIVNDLGNVLTPTPSSMVLDGVTRKKLIEKFNGLGKKVLETTISKSDLHNSKEIWLTNSVKGLRFVEQYEGMRFESKNSIFEYALSRFGRYGERV